MDSARRSILKTISWRLTGSGATFSIVYLITGDLSSSSTIALIQVFANTVLYYIHERVWNLIIWGKD